MSGRKCSTFCLQQEREEKLRLLQSLGNLHTEAHGLKERLIAMPQNTSEGLRTTFAEDFQQAQVWLAQVVLPDLRGLGMDTDISKLRNVQAVLEQTAAEGRHIQEQLTIILTQKADEMGQRLTRQLADVERSCLSRQHVLQLWCGARQLQAWEHTLQEARRLLGTEQYVALGQLLETLAMELGQQMQWAEAQESKHQKRLYLLKALRQVCTEMGFEEIAGPRYGREGERGSPILLTVDTLDRGRVAFTLSLEDISSFSEITQKHCFEEFGQLSRYLEEAFGIHTQFRPAEDELPPEIRHKGEVDLPKDAGMRAEA